MIISRSTLIKAKVLIAQSVRAMDSWAEDRRLEPLQELSLPENLKLKQKSRNLIYINIS